MSSIHLKTFHTKHCRLVPDKIVHGIRYHSPLSLTFLESLLFLHECFIPVQNSYCLISNPDNVAAHLKVSGQLPQPQVGKVSLAFNYFSVYLCCFIIITYIGSLLDTGWN